MSRIVLVDDHALVRMGFRMLLTGAGHDVVGECDSGEQACRDVPRLAPELVVMDLSMPGMGGLEALRRLHAQDERLPILVLSAHEDAAHASRALRTGALGYLAKRCAPEELLTAVKTVAAGERFVDDATARVMALASLERSGSPAEVLSEREFSVFLQLARGRSVQQIADDLKLAPSTVGTHLYHIKQKLAAANQAELTLIAMRWDLLAP